MGPGSDLLALQVRIAFLQVFQERIIPHNPQGKTKVVGGRDLLAGLAGVLLHLPPDEVGEAVGKHL